MQMKHTRIYGCSHKANIILFARIFFILRSTPKTASSCASRTTILYMIQQVLTGHRKLTIPVKAYKAKMHTIPSQPLDHTGYTLSVTDTPTCKLRRLSYTQLCERFIPQWFQPESNQKFMCINH